MDDAAVWAACSAVATGPRGLTEALREAAKDLQPDAIRILVAAGADVGARSGTRDGIQNSTPLHKVVCLFSCGAAMETAKVLIECGADVDSLDDFYNWTPLMHMVCVVKRSPLNNESEAVEMAKILVAAGADVDYRDDQGTSALDLAAEDELFEMASFLSAHAKWMRRKIWVAVCARGSCWALAA